MFCQPLHLCASVCDNVAGGGLEGCNLGGTWAKGFLHAIIPGMNVATNSRELNTLAKVQPIVIGVALSNPLGVIPGFPEWVNYFSERSLLYSTSTALLAVIAGSMTLVQQCLLQTNLGSASLSCQRCPWQRCRWQHGCGSISL